MSHKRNVKLLLLENVYNLGIVGDIVEVKPGYARNYLLPMGLATPPTQGAMNAVAERRAEVERKLQEERQHKEAMLKRLEGYEITLKRAANEQGVLFGSVSQRDIAETLTNEGFEIDQHDVRIGDPIKQLDSYDVPIQLDDDLRTEIKVWVVSDKPAEELLAEESQSEEAAEQPAADAQQQQTPNA